VKPTGCRAGHGGFHPPCECVNVIARPTIRVILVDIPGPRLLPMPTGRQPKDRRMSRALSWSVYLYFGLSAAHWWHVHQILHYPPQGLWCGNVVTDPYMILTKYLAPIVAFCMLFQILRRRGARHRPFTNMLILFVFLGTTAALVLEGYWLIDFGFPMHHIIWWFPWL
jgi:hypothetical protein